MALDIHLYSMKKYLQAEAHLPRAFTFSLMPFVFLENNLLSSWLSDIHDLQSPGFGRLADEEDPRPRDR